MKKPFILLLGVAFSAMSYFAIFQKTRGKESENEEQYKEGEKEEESGADKELSLWFQSKGYPNPNNLNDKYQAAWQQYLELKKREQNLIQGSKLPTGHRLVMYPQSADGFFVLPLTPIIPITFGQVLQVAEYGNL